MIPPLHLNYTRIFGCAVPAYSCSNRYVVWHKKAKVNGELDVE